MLKNAGYQFFRVHVFKHFPCAILKIKKQEEEDKALLR